MKFKYFFCFIVVVGVFLQSQGQCNSKIIPVEKKLSGTWQWTNIKDTFTIKLSYIDTFWQSRVTKDTFGPKIYGWHRFVENGEEIESSFPNSPDQRPFSKGFFGVIMNKEKILLMFHDITRARDFWVDAEFLDSTATSIKWITHRPQERVFYPPPKPKIWGGQTIPSPIILRKIID